MKGFLNHYKGGSVETLGAVNSLPGDDSSVTLNCGANGLLFLKISHISITKLLVITFAFI